MHHQPRGYSGPLSRHMLSYYSVISTLQASLRDLVEMSVATMFLEGYVERDRDDWMDLSLGYCLSLALLVFSFWPVAVYLSMMSILARWESRLWHTSMSYLTARTLRWRVPGKRWRPSVRHGSNIVIYAPVWVTLSSYGTRYVEFQQLSTLTELTDLILGLQSSEGGWKWDQGWQYVGWGGPVVISAQIRYGE